MVTIHAKLLVKESDILGYVTYVFENLDDNSFGHKYVMITRWPNWEHRILKANEIGYLTYNEVCAGKDEWWDGTKFIPYNFSNLIFIKFIEEKQIDNSKEILL